MNKLLIYTILVISLFSCQTVLDNVPVPEIPQKAVVFGSIEEGGTFHTLRVTKSKPIFSNSPSNEFEVIPNAAVTVTSGGNEYVYVFNSTSQNYEYRGVIDIISGEASLKVETPTLGTLTSTVSAPAALDGYTLLVDSTERSFEKEYAVQFTLPASSNPAYYRIDGYVAYASDTFSSYSSNEYHTNEDVLDKELKIKTSFYNLSNEDGGSTDLYVRLSSISEDHYTYGKALVGYEPDNPFSEPTPLPNNVEGGLGIFGISRSVVIKLN